MQFFYSCSIFVTYSLDPVRAIILIFYSILDYLIFSQLGLGWVDWDFDPNSFLPKD